MAKSTEDLDAPRPPLGTVFTRKHAVVLSFLTIGIVAVFLEVQARRLVRQLAPHGSTVTTTPGSATPDRPVEIRRGAGGPAKPPPIRHVRPPDPPQP
jgi:hypothetical protein